MKKLLSIAVALVMLMSFVSVAAYAAGEVYGLYCADGYVYACTSDGGAISGAATLDKNTVTHLFIDEAVTVISGAQFRSCTSLISVTAPKVTTVGSQAFQWCDALKSAQLPEVQTLGEYAFGGCEVLESISLPKAVTIDA